MKNQGRKDMWKHFLNYLPYFEVTDSLYYFDCAQGLERHEAKSMVKCIKWRGKAQQVLLSSRSRMKFTVTCINHSLLQGLLRGTTQLNTKERDITICLLRYVLWAYGVFYKGSIHCTAPLLCGQTHLAAVCGSTLLFKILSKHRQILIVTPCIANSVKHSHRTTKNYGSTRFLLNFATW